MENFQKILLPNLLSLLGSTEFNSQVLEYTEQFVVKLYDPSSCLKSVNALWAKLIKINSPETLSPSQDALIQHIKHAHYHIKYRYGFSHLCPTKYCERLWNRLVQGWSYVWIVTDFDEERANFENNYPNDCLQFKNLMHFKELFLL